MEKQMGRFRFLKTTRRTVVKIEEIFRETILTNELVFEKYTILCKIRRDGKTRGESRQQFIVLMMMTKTECECVLREGEKSE